jgi:YidC/Oxa1 family membrane protein insertase
MDRKSILILAAAFLLFLIWNPLMVKLGLLPPPDREEPVQQTQTDPSRNNNDEAPQGQVVPDASTEDGEGETAQAARHAKPSVAKPDDQPSAASALPRMSAQRFPLIDSDNLSAEQMPQIESDLVKAAFNSYNGGFFDYKLKKYMTVDRTQNIQLGWNAYPFCRLLLPAGLKYAKEKSRWTSRNNTVVRESTLLDDDGNPINLVETWQFISDSSYRFDYSISLENKGENDLVVSRMRIALGSIGLHDGLELPPEDKRKKGMETFQADFRMLGEKNNRVRIKGKKLFKNDDHVNDDYDNDPLRWGAIHNKYFVSFLKPVDEDDHFTGIQVKLLEARETPKQTDAILAEVFLDELVLKAGTQRQVQYMGYVGPKELKRVTPLVEDSNALMTVDRFFFGRAAWVGKISQLVIWLLVSIRSFFGEGWGTGFAIIVVTVMVKLLLWPLTHRGMVSMRKMQKIQPLVSEIKEKYKDDPQTCNKKVMELYSEHKVNPFGGCFPLLLQLPVFIALFNALRNAVELRQAAFLWVVDLSRPDTIMTLLSFDIRPMAFIMGGSMILQQLMAPSSSDPSQKRMMMFMTVFLMFIFYRMPAGLNLYWTINQLLTIVQHLVSNKLDQQKKQAEGA